MNEFLSLYLEHYSISHFNIKPVRNQQYCRKYTDKERAYDKFYLLLKKSVYIIIEVFSINCKHLPDNKSLTNDGIDANMDKNS